MIVNKVAVMLVMIAVGYIITKKGILSERGASEITTILLKIVIPCVIVSAFLNADKSLKATEMLMAVAISALSMFISIAITYALFRKEPDERKKVLRFCIVFSNAGFMGIPLIQAIVGETGVIYGSFFVVVFNVISWTYGYQMMSGGQKISLKVIFLNPGIVGIAIGLPIFFFNLQMPAIITEPIGFFSNLNTPLAMLVVGTYIAKVDLKSLVSDIGVYKVGIFRLIISPMIFLGALILIKPAQDMMLSCMIQASAPVAANAVLFAVQFKRDSALASKSVAVTTILSIITIPIFVILAQLVIQYLY